MLGMGANPWGMAKGDRIFSHPILGIFLFLEKVMAELQQLLCQPTGMRLDPVPRF